MSSDERTGVLPAVCVFDAYGTLFDLASATRRHLDALGDRAAPLADLWRAKQLEYTWLRSLMDDAWVPFEQVVADALDHAMEALALDQPATRDALLAAFRQLETYPEVPGVLTKLRGAGIRTAVLSNGSRGMLDAAVESAGLAPLLDAVLSVDDVGVFKPHPAVYRLAMEHFALAPERGRRGELPQFEQLGCGRRRALRLHRRLVQPGWRRAGAVECRARAGGAYAGRSARTAGLIVD
jgi:2-haloacid dehalogenase